MLLGALGMPLSAQDIDTAYKNTPIEKVFSDLREKTNHEFVYQKQILQGIKPVTCSVKNKSLEEVLDQVLRGTGLTYEIVDNTVIIRKGEKKDAQQSLPGNKRTLTGTVLDTQGEPLPGASIYVKGDTKNGVTADAEGRFTLSVPQKTKAVIVSFVGMNPQEVVLLDKTENYVVRLESSTTIDEVVVTGIVTKRKDTFTGSSASFSGEELKAVGVQNPLASLRSLDPSFNLMESDIFGSDPNRLPDIEIRGKSSIMGMRDEVSEDPNQPLFILDGFESTLETIYNLDINRIASMTILKDAASTAIYGSKAANGVVVVETVKPQPGQLRLSYNGSMDISWPDLTSYNLMNAREKLEFERLAGKYSETGVQDIIEKEALYNKHLADINSGVDTYWLAEPVRTGINHRHQLYADGGAGGFMFGIGLNYNGVTGVMKKSDRDVLGANLDLIYRVGKLQFTNKFTAQQTKYSNPIVPFSDYVRANPYYKKYNEEGEVERWLANSDLEPEIGNPLYNDSLNSRDDNTQVQFSDYFIAEYNPTNELKLRARFGLTSLTAERELFYSPDDTRFESYDVLRKGSYDYTNSKTTKYEGEFTAIYATVLNEKHRINIAIGGNMSEQKTILQGYSAEGFPSGDFTYPSFANGYAEDEQPTYTESVSRAVSAYLTGGYAFADKYLMDVSYRLNGSSVFGSNKQFINTWSLGLGWNIHNENFIKDNAPWINYLKIRGSIGNPGNQNFDSALSLTTFRYLYTSYNYFGMSSVLQTLGNRNLEWQTTLDRNIGLDVTLFNERFSMTLDYYWKTTDPLLLAIGLPSSSGITSYNTNFGKQLSTGFTGTVQYYIFRDFDKRLTWSLRGTIRMENSKLDGIGNSLASMNEYNQSRSTERYYDGADPDDIWAVRSAGIDPATGREIFIKKDGTYTYDFSYDDEVVVGNSRPTAEGTFGSSFGYKGFTAGVTFRYRLGGESFNSAVYNKVENISSTNLNNNQDRRALYDRWQQPGDIAQFKNIADATSTPMSSRFVQTENTLTLESFQVGYEFDPIFARKLGISGLRINAYMNDIFRVSSIREERGTSYPFARSISFALSFTL